MEPRYTIRMNDNTVRATARTLAQAKKEARALAEAENRTMFILRYGNPLHTVQPSADAGRAKPKFVRRTGVTTSGTSFECVLCWDTKVPANMPSVQGGRAGIVCMGCARDIQRMDLTLKQSKRKAKRKKIRIRRVVRLGDIK